MNLFRFIPGYESGIYEEGKEPLLLLLLAFLITFALVRFYTRMARTKGWGSASVGGAHMHHVVVGVILMSFAGTLAFTQFGSSDIVYGVAAIVFGIGLALTLDEFAMILHLKDVYWAREGRTSIDALIMGAAGAGILLVSASPFTTDGRPKPGSDIALELTIGGTTITIAAWLGLLTSFIFAVVVFLKKKPLVGVLALGLIPFGIVGAVRLAKPDSPWVRWFYDPDRGSDRFRARRRRKLERSTSRFTAGPYGRFERWFSDLVGGAPTIPSPPAEESPTPTA